MEARSDYHRRTRTTMDEAEVTEKTADEGGGKAIILVVERDPHVRELEAHFLDNAGYSVAFAQDGSGALEQARRVLPDIIITEILVPTLDGLSLCRQLKDDPRTREIAVLIFSVLSAAGRAREAGADAFLLKPLAEHTLVDTVRQLLEARGARMRRARDD
jgi:CheY-like chemotaxis protein